jgi:hypothetical protein
MTLMGGEVLGNRVIARDLHPNTRNNGACWDP